MWAVDLFEADGMAPSDPVVFIDPWVYTGGSPTRTFDVLANGSILAITRGGNAREQFKVSEFQVRLNFIDELRERMRN